MGQSERPLTALGRHVAELQNRTPAARLDRERGRARLLAAARLPDTEQAARGSGLRRGSPGAPRLARLRGDGAASGPGLPAPGRPFAARRAVSLAAAALVVAALAVAFVARPRAPMRFELGTAEPGVVGAWIAAPTTAELPIRFSDGSLLRLAPGGRARVASVDADGAELSLERGALDLSVVHREGARWTVRVGPFQVHVIGTRFETRWDPETEQLVVALREGVITVSGPVVGDARAVRAGERLTISAATNTLAVGSIDAASGLTSTAVPQGAPASSAAAPGAPAPSEAAPGAAPSSATAPSAAATSAAAPSAAPSTSGPFATARAPGAGTAALEGRAGGGGSVAPLPARREASSWRALALEARYRDALAAAEGDGFDALCDAASASDLRALGDAARLGGSPARAAQAFASLRARFPGSPEAASAAFMLGRIAQDQSKDHAAAAGWFARYLSEQPAGPFAADAAGRLVEAEDRRGDEAGARRAAEQYLAAHPSGSHAGYAKHVLARGAKAITPGGSPGRPVTPGGSPGRPVTPGGSPGEPGPAAEPPAP
ncbi:FecR domain-containing protein [Sorangium atrum]|uniref:FecR domain-containing protein n=1 Tax=Sorangium atrum TaxID=2995308 RepID=A0ABT5BTZ6_9BACT|nr:FecR domain-containing protein [Sorangium aterium]MDC0677621.1 FecR domain-containing protein [Sorangium aterium]